MDTQVSPMDYQCARHALRLKVRLGFFFHSIIPFRCILTAASTPTLAFSSSFPSFVLTPIILIPSVQTLAPFCNADL